MLHDAEARFDGVALGMALGNEEGMDVGFDVTEGESLGVNIDLRVAVGLEEGWANGLEENEGFREGAEIFDGAIEGQYTDNEVGGSVKSRSSRNPFESASASFLS